MDAWEAQSPVLTHTVAARPALKGPRRRSASASAPCRIFGLIFLLSGTFTIVLSAFDFVFCLLGCAVVMFENIQVISFFEGFNFWSKLPLLEDLCHLQAFDDPVQSIVARWSIWTHLTLSDTHSQTQVVVEVMVLLVF